MNKSQPSQDKTNETKYNSCKHGLTARGILKEMRTFNESYETYLEILNGYRACLLPQNFIEEALVESISKAHFKLQRLDMLEVGHFEPSIMGNNLTINDLTTFDLLIRYKTNLENQYFRALSMFKQTQNLFCKVTEIK